jgi:DNA helicase II / ATP-dependent DNA helicase PcrA
MLMTPPRTKRLFISYRSSDAAKVDKIARDLGLLKYDDGTPRYIPWQDKHSLPPASPNWWDAIVDAIMDCDMFVFNLSWASLQSEVCRAELDYAHKRNRPIIPVVLDGEFILNSQSGKYDLLEATWALIPDWLGESQFLFYVGTGFYNQVQEAVEGFERRWPRDINVLRPMNPDSKSIHASNHALYDAACDYAERLAFADAQKHFNILVRRSDPDYADVAAQWLELLHLYEELIDIDSRPNSKFIFPKKWTIYISQFPKTFLDRVFDPKDFRGRQDDNSLSELKELVTQSPVLGEIVYESSPLSSSIGKSPTDEIVASTAETLRIVAGPGTGKTYSLVRRVSSIISSGIEPENILLVTFTRMAAKDLLRELATLNVPKASNIVTGTLHAFCLSVLMKAEVFLQTGRTASRLLLEMEERFLLEDITYDHSQNKVIEFGDYYERLSRFKAFEAAWARDQHQIPGTASDTIDRHFQGLLYDWLRFHNAMLVSEITPEALKYLRDNPACEDRSRFSHVLVDEYQDLNKAEQKLIDLFSSNASLTLIGDEDQSIYEALRFAHPEGILELSQIYPKLHDIPLNICHRCPEPVVNIATSLIGHNVNRANRDLYASKSNTEANIFVLNWEDMEAEAEGIAKYLHSQLELGIFSPGEILILSPRRQIGQLIKEKLLKLGQNVRSFFKEEILDGNPKKSGSSDAQQAFTLLQLAVNLQDRVALRCWLGFGSNDLGSKQYQIVYQYGRTNNKSPKEVLDDVINSRLDLKVIKHLVSRYELLLQKLQEIDGKTSVEQFDILFPNNLDWAESFRAVVPEIDNNSTLDDILSALREEITQPVLPTHVDYIRIMSLHKSKGLTADHVIVVGCVNGLIPMLPDEKLSDEAKGRFNEEQRRLFYVAITRPRKTLILSSTVTLPVTLAYRMNMKNVVKVVNGGDSAKTSTSGFIAELGSACPTPILGKSWKY